MSEAEEIYKRYIKDVNQERLEKLEKYQVVITNFIHFCKSKGVELDDSNFNYIRRIGLVACYPNLLNLIDERIEVDKEGLIPTKVINELYPNKTTKT